VNVREIDTDTLAQHLATGATVVDVRERAEFVQARVPGAVNVPMGQLPARAGELDRTAPVYLICATGNRSGVMTEVLSRAGYDAVNVVGGTAAWARAGRQIERG
jgi:rhodanese-related sulfurtransferase